MLMVLCLLGLLLIARPAQAQSTDPAGKSGLPDCARERRRLTTPEFLQQDCILGVGDHFYITCRGEHDCFQRPFLVGTDGTIPFGNFKMQAAGLAVSELTVNVYNFLAPSLKFGSISVLLEPEEPTYW